MKRRALERGYWLGSSGCGYYLSLWSVEEKEEACGGDHHRGSFARASEGGDMNRY